MASSSIGVPAFGSWRWRPWCCLVSVPRSGGLPPRRTPTNRRADARSRPTSSPGTVPRTKPVVIWIHGGGLINGSRKGIPGYFREVGAETRVTPWCRSTTGWPRTRSCRRSSRTFRTPIAGSAPRVRSSSAPTRSASPSPGFRGWLSDPDERVLLRPAAHGPGLVLGIRRHHLPVVQPARAVLRQAARRAQGGSLCRRRAGRRSPARRPTSKQRGRFYLYCRQQGIWPKEVAGHDPDTENEWFNAYCPIRNVSRGYPPTLLIHGTDDTDVPYRQSKDMAGEARRGRRRACAHHGSRRRSWPGGDRRRRASARINGQCC